MNTATTSGGQSSPGKRTQQAFTLDPILKDEVVQLTCQSPRLAEAVDTLHVEVVNQFADRLSRQIAYPLRVAKWERRRSFKGGAGNNTLSKRNLYGPLMTKTSRKDVCFKECIRNLPGIH